MTEYLKQGGYAHHLRMLRRTLEEAQTHMVDAIDKEFPVRTRYTRPEGGYFLWIELPEYANSLALYRRALKRRITIVPGPIFSPHQRFRNAIRLNYGVQWSARMDSAMRELGKIIRS
ncbi:MAG TPA: hypothetical protein VGO08_07160 [Burkholderiales bacterium]|jgi:DNA-binding transcriptional MocR family regulator|nr:hypothetical protein [Burkholderiales bacterium]